MTLSGAQSKAMAWNLKQPFRLQLRRLQKIAEKEAISGPESKAMAQDLEQPFRLQLRRLRRKAEREAISNALSPINGGEIRER